ncbi:protease IV [Phycisphaera mikurensis NBRC 102666]|uniref:Protease IV n=2 Tax=Phycisphaera TaxID=666508 RepID=I0IFY6_PHYMF|nr:protease IV [Phycisphaera mikurensis NBRC 102666]
MLRLLPAALALAAACPASAAVAPVTTDDVADAAEQAVEALPVEPAEESVAPAAAGREASQVGWLEIEGSLRQGPAPFSFLDPADLPPSLSDVLAQIERVETSDDHAGLVVHLKGPELSLSQAGALRRGLERLKTAGKPVVVFAAAYDTTGYYLASVADRLLLQRNGSLELQGIAVEEMYLAGMLEKVGVEADLMQVGRFKGAEETFTRTGPSEAWSENIEGLLDGLYGGLLGGIAAGRGMDRAEAEAAMADAWLLDDAGLVERGLIDAAVERGLTEETSSLFGEDFAWDTQLGRAGGSAMPTSPFALFAQLMNPPARGMKRDGVAVLHLNGPIGAGESGSDDGLFSSASIGQDSVVEQAAELAADERVKAVVLRLDSPGGSAHASEMMFQALEDLAAVKPVLVSIGSMAASGGYYLAVAGDTIYAEPTAIVGSIGVVGGKMSLGGLYEKLGVGIHRRSRGPNTGYLDSTQPFTDAQRERVRASMVKIYDLFKERVAGGRGERLGELAEVDAGRLFTGEQALEKGMIDAVGGLPQAIAAAASAAGLGAGYEVEHLPEPLPFPEAISAMFGGAQVSAVAAKKATLPAAAAAARRLLGPAAWTAAAGWLDAAMQLRTEPVLLLHPAAIVIR